MALRFGDRIGMEKIIIDTDPGQDIDDILAIWFALLRPELDIRAITTVTYPSFRRAEIVGKLLTMLGRHNDIPVAAGMELPLRVIPRDELDFLHDESKSLNHYEFTPRPPAAAPLNDATRLIIDTVMAHPGDIVLVCIAPLTNIACAICACPEIVPKIKYIALMGGSFEPGRKEHNICFDYVAADIVVNSGVPVYMGSWEVTRTFGFTMDECAVFKDASEVARAMYRGISLWHPAQNWKPGPVMYDIFPLVWAFDRTMYSCRQASVEIETLDAGNAGMTCLRGNNPNTFIAEGISPEALKGIFLETVLGKS